MLHNIANEIPKALGHAANALHLEGQIVNLLPTEEMRDAAIQYHAHADLMLRATGKDLRPSFKNHRAMQNALRKRLAQ